MQFDQLKRREFITLAGRRGGGVAARRTRRFDTTEHNLRSTSVSRPLAARLTRLFACQAEVLRQQRRRCFLSLHFLFKDLTHYQE